MTIHRRLIAVACLLAGLATASGCLSTTQKSFLTTSSPTLGSWYLAGALPVFIGNEPGGAASRMFTHGWYWFPAPVSPALTDEIEQMIERIEKDKVAILEPIRGEFAPIFCMDPPTDKEIYETLPAIPHGVPFIWEVHRTNVRFSVEKIVDEIDECRFYPLAGPCQLHHCHFKCTIWWDETTTMGWPIPWTYTDHKQEVVYIDRDHLHRCGEPGNLTGAGGDISSYGGAAAGSYGRGGVHIHAGH
jgi:hypothetical protein